MKGHSYKGFLVNFYGVWGRIPIEILESSQLDGCGNIRYLFSILLPLSGPILAVMGLFYSVGYWNSYFESMIYLNNRTKYP